MTIGLAIIARDEEDNLPRLLRSIEGAFDQIALVDTGSTDRTVEVFEEWAERQALPLGHRVAYFDWCDDFSAARNFADEQLETDWLCWLDADDELRGASALRAKVEAVLTDVDGIVVRYDYAVDPVTGRSLSHYRPLRCVRAGTCRWWGRVQEAKALHPTRLVEIAPTVARVVHHRAPASLAISRSRDIKILARWLEDAPGDPLATATAALATIEQGGDPVHAGKFLSASMAAQRIALNGVRHGD